MNILGLVDIPLVWLLAIVFPVLLYKYLTWDYDFFTKQGIPGPKPMPLLGNTAVNKIFHTLIPWSKQYGSVYGIFVGRVPTFVITDVELLKEIFVKNFNSFRNRKKIPFLYYPFNLGVFFLEDAAWKRVRSIISPTFSSSRLKNMLVPMNECARVLTNNLSKTCGETNGVNVKKFFGAFTMDVIARTAFGVKVDSQNDLNNPFGMNALRILKPSRGARMWFVILAAAFPFISGILEKIRSLLFKADHVTFFVDHIKQVIKERQGDSKEVRESRADFLQLMMDAEMEESSGSSVSTQTKTNKRLTMDELVGQGILFFVAGYETTATTLLFTAYALARYPDVQDKVCQEIEEKLGNNEPGYDNIGKLKYMENVILETLRVHCPVLTLHRRAAETVRLGNITIPKDTPILIPTHVVHKDPNVHPRPDEFIPERHNEKGDPASFLPFGCGPRMCTGMRLALVEAKVALVHLLRKFKFETRDDTPQPDQLKFVETGVLTPDVPIMLNLSPRS